MNKFSRSASLLLIALAFLSLSLPTVAQSTLTGLSGPPTVSGGSLGPSFDPDPLPFEGISGGGSVRIALLNPNSGCLGRYSETPSFGFYLRQSVDLLRVFFIADDPDADATLIVRMPDQQYYCADDFEGGNNPLVDVTGNTTIGGVYIWVGSMYATPVTGTLYLSTDVDAHPFSVGQVVSSEEIALDPSAEPLAFVSAIGSQPYATLIFSMGGDVDIQSLGSDCAGYTTVEPIFRFGWNIPMGLLRIYLTPEDPAQNLSLIVLDPDGNYLCNDASMDTLHPTIDLEDPTPGTYTVWVGTMTPNEMFTGEIAVTRDRSYFAATEDEQLLTWAVMPESPPLDQNQIYENLTVGGSVDLSIGANGEDCLGYSTAMTTKSIGWMIRGPAFARVYFVPDDEDVDTTLAVLYSYNTWLCNDDSFDTLHPTIDIDVGQVGGPTLHIWVGTKDRDESVTGTLYLVYDEESNPASPATP